MDCLLHWYRDWMIDGRRRGGYTKHNTERSLLGALKLVGVI